MHFRESIYKNSEHMYKSWMISLNWGNNSVPKRPYKKMAILKRFKNTTHIVGTKEMVDRQVINVHALSDNHLCHSVEFYSSLSPKQPEINNNIILT